MDGEVALGAVGHAVAARVDELLVARLVFVGAAGLEVRGEHAAANQVLILAHDADVVVHQAHFRGKRENHAHGCELAAPRGEQLPETDLVVVVELGVEIHEARHRPCRRVFCPDPLAFCLNHLGLCANRARKFVHRARVGLKHTGFALHVFSLPSIQPPPGTAKQGHCCSFSPIPTAEAQSRGSLVRNRRTGNCRSFSPIPAAEAQSMGSVVRNRRTGNCHSFSPVPAAEAQSRGSLVRNRRTEALLFVLSRTRRRSAGNRGSLVRKYRTEALPFGISRARLRRFKCRRDAGIGEALSGTAVRRQPRPAPPPRPMPPPPNPPPKPPRPPSKPRPPPKDDGREPRPCQPRREGCMPPTQPYQNHAPKGV